MTKLQANYYTIADMIWFFSSVHISSICVPGILKKLNIYVSDSWVRVIFIQYILLENALYKTNPYRLKISIKLKQYFLFINLK